jgi:DNA-binding MarR family transcriptional regulator
MKARCSPNGSVAPLKRQPRSHSNRSECLACRTLVAVARQRKGLDAERCQLVFEHLNTSQVLQSSLHRVLADYHLSDLQFGVLVAMFTLDPEPVAPADLADYNAVSRAAITEALVRLEGLNLIARTRDEADRRVFHLRLTATGATTINEALVSYLRAVGEAARHVAPSSLPTLLEAYSRLQQGAIELSS